MTLSQSQDYPRMLFHRTKDPVTVQSREEEDALGPGWARTIWAATTGAAPEPASEPEPDQDHHPEPEPEPEPEKEVSPVPPRRPVKPPARLPAAPKTAKKRR